MHLIKYKVNKFRSVKGTEWIETNKWSCLVGLNESGKTNLLLPLWKFNPADGSKKVDLLLDYPRDEYSKIGVNDGTKKTEPFIETLFSLTDTELEKIKKNYETYLNPPQESENGEQNGSGEKHLESVQKIEFTNFLLIKKDYNENFYIHVSDENCEESTTDIKKNVGDALFKEICNMIPKFVYYSEYGY